MSTKFIHDQSSRTVNLALSTFNSPNVVSRHLIVSDDTPKLTTSANPFRGQTHQENFTPLKNYQDLRDSCDLTFFKYELPALHTLFAFCRLNDPHKRGLNVRVELFQPREDCPGRA